MNRSVFAENSNYDRQLSNISILNFASVSSEITHLLGCAICAIWVVKDKGVLHFTFQPKPCLISFFCAFARIRLH